MAFLKLIVFQHVILAISSTLIEYNILGSPNLLQANISGRVLNDQTIDLRIINVRKVRYENRHSQISTVTNLPRLTNVWLEKTGHEFAPVFFNLPRIETISLDHNELVFITSDSFGLTPTVYVFLRFNKISKIEDGSFGEGVKHVYLACNRLQTVDAEWFKNPAKLEILDLDANKIEYIEENKFKKFARLEYVYLLHNNLQVIGDGAFSARRSFSELWLGYNNLTELQPTVFNNENVTIEWLDISFNKLSFLSPKFLTKVKCLYAVQIDGNPWQCQCYYYNIIQWVPWDSYDDHPDRKGEPRCVAHVGPLAEKCVTYVDAELIELFLNNSSPPPQTKEQYCDVKSIRK